MRVCGQEKFSDVYVCLYVVAFVSVCMCVCGVGGWGEGSVLVMTLESLELATSFLYAQ